MKKLTIAVLFLGGCIGAPFEAEDDDEHEMIILETGPAVYPSTSVVAPPPLPPRSSRPAPGRSR